MKNIYIVGFMGTGKTVVGRELAKKLNAGFVDLDEAIEEKEKTTISDIFQTKGEEHFRSLEKEALAGVATQKGCVVSCGGGIVVDPADHASDECDIRVDFRVGHIVQELLHRSGLVHIGEEDSGLAEVHGEGRSEVRKTRERFQHHTFVLAGP